MQKVKEDAAKIQVKKPEDLKIIRTQYQEVNENYCVTGDGWRCIGTLHQHL